MSLLPELHDRAVPPHRHRTSTCPPATSAWAAARSATSTVSTSASPACMKACSPARACPTAAPWPAPRPPATACAYLMDEMLEASTATRFAGKRVVVSGSGNVAIYASEKVTQLGGKVVAMCDSTGWIYDEDGVDLTAVKQHQGSRARRASSEYVNERPKRRIPRGRLRIWDVPCDVALPCATQNELHAERRQDADQERRHRRGRGREHAHHARKRRRSSSRTASSLPPARRPTPAAWPPPRWRCPRTACA